MNLASQYFDLASARACVQASADAYHQSTISNTNTDTHLLIQDLTPPPGAPAGGSPPGVAARGLSPRTQAVFDGAPPYRVPNGGPPPGAPGAPGAQRVAFRGSASLRNWITDAEFHRTPLTPLRPFPGGSRPEVHRGFRTALDSVLDPLIDALGGCPPPGASPVTRPLHLTGHSLGGALAILAALELSRLGFPIAGVYTFGQPRVGNRDFKALYETPGPDGAHLGDRTFLFVFQEDLVPRIPCLPALYDPYRHVGNAVFISSLPSAPTDADLWLNPPLWRVLLSDAWGLWRARRLSRWTAALDPFADHHIDRYLTTLNRVAPENQAQPGIPLPSGNPTLQSSTPPCT